MQELRSYVEPQFSSFEMPVRQMLAAANGQLLPQHLIVGRLHHQFNLNVAAFMDWRMKLKTEAQENPADFIKKHGFVFGYPPAAYPLTGRPRVASVWMSADTFGQYQKQSEPLPIFSFLDQEDIPYLIRKFVRGRLPSAKYAGQVKPLLVDDILIGLIRMGYPVTSEHIRTALAETPQLYTVAVYRGPNFEEHTLGFYRHDSPAAPSSPVYIRSTEQTRAPNTDISETLTALLHILDKQPIISARRVTETLKAAGWSGKKINAYLSNFKEWLLVQQQKGETTEIIFATGRNVFFPKNHRQSRTDFWMRADAQLPPDAQVIKFKQRSHIEKDITAAAVRVAITNIPQDIDTIRKAVEVQLGHAVDHQTIRNHLAFLIKAPDQALSEGVIRVVKKRDRGKRRVFVWRESHQDSVTHS